MHVGLDRHPGGLGRALEQGPDHHLEPEVGEGGGDHLLAAVVAVLAHLGHQQLGGAALRLGEGPDRGAGPAHARIVPGRPGVDVDDALGRGLVAAEHPLQRQADLSDRRLGPGRFDGEGQQVGAVAGAGGQGGQGGRGPRLIPFGPEPRQLFDLAFAHRGVVDLQHWHVVGRLRAEAVHADHGLAAGVDAGLGLGGGGLDSALGQARLDRPRHAAEGVDLGDMVERAPGEVVGQPLDVDGAAPRVDRAGQARLGLQQDLGVAGDAG